MPLFVQLDGSQLGATVVVAPCPGVAEPERGKQVKRCRLRPTVGRTDTDQDVSRVGFGIFDGDIEVSIFRKDTWQVAFIVGVFVLTSLSLLS